MVLYTNYTNSEDLKNQLSDSISIFFEKYNKISTVLTKELTPLQKDTLHFIGKYFKSDDPVTKAMCRVIGRAILQTETHAGGSANASLLYSLSLILNVIKINQLKEIKLDICDDYRNFVTSLKKEIEQKSFVPTEQDLNDICNVICDSPLLARVVMEAVTLSGIDGIIYIEDSKQPNFTIERKIGYSFNVKPNRLFFTTNQKSWERRNVRVFLVDGFIEKVSEIEQILNGAYKEKQSTVIIAKGFAEEVLATLKVNMDKELMDVIAVLIPSELEYINTLNDIAAVTGANIVSSLKGDMLCTQKWEELVEVDRVRCIQGQIVIEESKTKANVSIHLKNLLEKRVNATVEDIADLLDKRIKSLCGDSVCIRLPDTTEIENNATRVKLDVALRTIKSTINHNMITLSNLLECVEASDKENILTEVVSKSIKNMIHVMGNKKISCLSAYLMLYVAGQQALLFATSNGAVLEV